MLPGSKDYLTETHESDGSRVLPSDCKSQILHSACFANIQYSPVRRSFVSITGPMLAQSFCNGLRMIGAICAPNSTMETNLAVCSQSTTRKATHISVGA